MVEGSCTLVLKEESHCVLYCFIWSHSYSGRRDFGFSVASLIDDDNKSLPSDGDLLPQKRRSVDTGDGVARAVDLIEGDFLLHAVTILIRDDIEPGSEISRLADVDVGMPLPSMVTEAEGSIAEVIDTSRREKASNS